MMKILKVYNNNIVSADKEGSEVIIVGSGIGFKKKPGDLIDKNKVDKIYTFESRQQSQLKQLLDRVPLLYFRISEAIASKASEKLQVQLSNQILISLSDHICYAVERKRKGISVPNLMLNEIRSLYKQEFKIGLWAIKFIQVNTGIALDENEAGYIAMHIVNAMVGSDIEYTQISKILRFIKDVQRIVEEFYSIEFNEQDLNHARFITHLKFLGQHIFSEESGHNEIKVDDLFSFLTKRDDRILECVNEISAMVEHDYNYVLQESEKVYLMIHIIKIIS